MSAPGAIPVGVGTGVGSMPGTDPREAMRIVAGEAGLAYLPELPDRGPGADLIGRTGGLLIDIPVDLVHRTYRLAAAPTSLTRRSRDFLRWDLDALEEEWETGGIGAGTVVKVQACGPFTFAAHTELRGGHKIVRDRGAVRDIADSLAHGLAEHAAEVARRTGAQVVVQLDEPSIGAVLDGTVTPLTRLDPVPPIPVPDVVETLSGIADTVGLPMILHTCAAPRWELLSRLPSYALSLDLTLLTEDGYDPLGEWLDGGRVLFAGVVPAVDPGLAESRLTDDLAGRLSALVARLGLPARVLGEQVAVTPVCGLAGASPRWAATALSIASSLARH